MSPGPLHIGDQGQVCLVKTWATGSLYSVFLVNLQFKGYKVIAFQHCVTATKLGF